MKDSDYIRAFRFGFGVKAGQVFDPFTEVKEPKSQADLQASRVAHEARFEVLAEAMEHVRKSSGGREEKKALNALSVRLNQQDVHSAVARAVDSKLMFTERLALFWSNHFTLGIGNVVLRRFAGLHAAGLRAHMFGRFRDVLEAGVLSPGMIEYLNLQQAVGPNSKAGQRTGKGLNENLGREILELHSLGVDGGYDQDDVLALSKLLTGWRYDPLTGDVGFVLRRAEPGSKVLLGKSIGAPRPAASDMAEALDLLAAHPSTANFIARKLVEHFLGPRHEEVSTSLAQIFLQSGGELRPVYAALLDAAEDLPPVQFRNDAVFLISALRALPLRKGALDVEDVDDEKARGMRLTVGAFNQLRQKLWVATTPEGWPDDPVYWRAPAVIAARLKVIPKLVQFAESTEPLVWAQSLLGPFLRKQTERAVSLAPNRQQGLGLVLASPEFNRS